MISHIPTAAWKTLHSTSFHSEFPTVPTASTAGSLNLTKEEKTGCYATSSDKNPLFDKDPLAQAVFDGVLLTLFRRLPMAGFDPTTYRF